MKSSLTKFAGAVALILFAGYAFVALQGPHGVPDLMEKRRQIREYEKKNAELARQIEEERARIGRFNEGKPEQELKIRERLNLVKPEEKMFLLQEQKSAPASPAAQHQ